MLVKVVNRGQVQLYEQGLKPGRPVSTKKQETNRCVGIKLTL